MSNERRDSHRYTVLFPMQYDSAGDGESFAISRNMSRNGLLMATATRLEVGAAVKVSFQLASTDRTHVVQGQIVRVGDNSADPDGIWPFLAAVQFDAVAPELEALLAQAGTERR